MAAPRLIKRYSNRKLYDTETRTYITLESIAALVLEGADIRVVDNDTDEDITTVILSQLLLERERARRSLSSGLLSGLLRSGETLGRGLSSLTRPIAGANGWLNLLEHEVERSFKFWLEMAQGREEEVLRVIEGLVEKRRKARTAPAPPGLGLLHHRDLDDFESWQLEEIPTEQQRQEIAFLLERLAHLLPQVTGAPALHADLQTLHDRLQTWLENS